MVERTNSTTTQPLKKSPKKIGIVQSMLGLPEGATLAELTAATGWQNHTVRAALTVLRKKGIVIVKRDRGGSTCYVVEQVVENG